MKFGFAFLSSMLAAATIAGGAFAISYAQTGDSAVDTTGGGNATIGNETALASGNVTVTVTPFAQVPDRTVLVEANGLAPNANTTIIVDNGVAATSETDENGTLLYALGVPDQITITEIRVDNSTGEESVRNITNTWEGTVSVVVRDQFGSQGAGELTVIRPVGQSGANANNTGNATGP